MCVCMYVVVYLILEGLLKRRQVAPFCRRGFRTPCGMLAGSCVTRPAVGQTVHRRASPSLEFFDYDLSSIIDNAQAAV